MSLEFTDANFQTTVMESDKLTVIDFWAEWCGPCRAIGPVIEELATQYEGKVNIGKVNVDVNPTLSMNFGITSIPAIGQRRLGQVTLWRHEFAISNSVAFVCTPVEAAPEQRQTTTHE